MFYFNVAKHQWGYAWAIPTSQIKNEISTQKSVNNCCLHRMNFANSDSKPTDLSGEEHP
jgi:hypothetical protein